MDDHKPLETGEGSLSMSSAVLDEVPELPSDAALVERYRNAAEEGDIIAQITLGYLYGSGQGVPQDEVAAASWYRKAADACDRMAQYTLANMLDEGRGVTPDRSEAAILYGNLQLLGLRRPREAHRRRGSGQEWPTAVRPASAAAAPRRRHRTREGRGRAAQAPGAMAWQGRTRGPAAGSLEREAQAPA